MKNYFYHCSFDSKLTKDVNDDIVLVSNTSRMFMSEAALYASIEADFQRLKAEAFGDDYIHTIRIKETSPHREPTEVLAKKLEDPNFIEYLSTWDDELERVTIIQVDEEWEEGDPLPCEIPPREYLAQYNVMSYEDGIQLKPSYGHQNINSTIH